jgi:crotonobetainyl-CoA:carnitine CoA-transferase CaiB-like acyl-CoA transferase
MNVVAGRPSGDAPLDGLVTVEVGAGVGVSGAGLLLGEFGSQVRKYSDDAEHTPFWCAMNRGKSVHDIARLRDGGVHASADLVVAESEYFERQDEIGDALRALAAQALAVVEICGDGPGVMRPWDSLVSDSLAGLATSRLGTRPGPFASTVPIGAIGASMLSVIGLLATAFDRQRTGESAGDRIRVDYLDGAVTLNMTSSTFVASAAASPFSLAADERSVAGTPLLRFCRAQNGWLALGVATKKQWIDLCLWLDRPDLLIDARLADAPLVITDREASAMVAAAIEDVTRTRPVDELVEAIAALHIGAAPALSSSAVFDHPHTVASGHIVGAECAGREQRLVGNFLRFVHPERSGQSLAASSEHQQSGCGPLAGVRVMDVATFVASPFASKILADLGADVIKVETLDGDPLRQLGFSCSAVNRGKRSIAIDLRTDDGRALLSRLVASSDVVITNVARARAEAFGLDEHSLRQAQPAVHVVHVSGFGASGPYAGRVVFDPIAAAMSGIAVEQGGGEPFGYVGGLCDNAGGPLAAAGVLASLVGAQRHASGGSLIEVSLFSSGLFVNNANITLGPRLDEHRLDADRLRFPSGDGIYRTRDGWLALKNAHPDAVRQLGKEFGEHLVTAIAELDTTEALERLHALDGVRASRVTTMPELRAQRPELFSVWHDERWGDLVQPRGVPANLVIDTPPYPVVAGADSAAVLAELGVPPDEVARLAAAGVINPGAVPQRGPEPAPARSVTDGR